MKVLVLFLCPKNQILQDIPRYYEIFQDITRCHFLNPLPPQDNSLTLRQKSRFKCEINTRKM